MHTISDVFFWRAVFLLAMIGALLLGVGIWHAAAWINKRTRLSGGRKRLVASVVPRQLGA